MQGDSLAPAEEGRRDAEDATTQGAGGEGEEKVARKELYNLKVARANNRTYTTAKQDLFYYYVEKLTPHAQPDWSQLCQQTSHDMASMIEHKALENCTQCPKQDLS